MSVILTWIRVSDCALMTGVVRDGMDTASNEADSAQTLTSDSAPTEAVPATSAAVNTADNAVPATAPLPSTAPASPSGTAPPNGGGVIAPAQPPSPGQSAGVAAPVPVSSEQQQQQRQQQALQPPVAVVISRSSSPSNSATASAPSTTASAASMESPATRQRRVNARLLVAAQAGVAADVVAALSLGADVFAADTAGWTAAHIAAWRRHAGVLQALVEHCTTTVSGAEGTWYGAKGMQRDALRVEMARESATLCCEEVRVSLQHPCTKLGNNTPLGGNAWVQRKNLRLRWFVSPFHSVVCYDPLSTSPMFAADVAVAC